MRMRVELRVESREFSVDKVLCCNVRAPSPSPAELIPGGSSSLDHHPRAAYQKHLSAFGCASLSPAGAGGFCSI